MRPAPRRSPAGHRARPASCSPSPHHPSAADTAPAVGSAIEEAAHAGFSRLGILQAGAGQHAHDRSVPLEPILGRQPAGSRPGSAADDGSQKMPSCRARSRQAARIWSSLTASIRPPDSSRAATAFVQLAGSPIRIAVAIVSGASTRWPRTIGAAPSAWKPNIRGSDSADAGRPVIAEAGPVGTDVAGVAHRDGQDIRRPAEVVADLEGARSSGPSRRYGLTELTRVIGWAGEPASSRTTRERLVEVALDRHDPGARDLRLEELAGGDLAARQDDDDLEAGGRAVRRRRRRGVARRGTDQRPGAGFEGLADGHDHAPVLEAAGRVLAFDLRIEVGQRRARRRSARGGRAA